jgi:pimeloyl-ACP methyl ester carboxylesterase
VTLNLVRRGSGTPVVLVHGIGGCWQHFEPVIDLLAEHHDVIAIDLPGFGRSPLIEGVEPGPYGFADWLEGWLADQGIVKPHVVGNSMGGAVALELGRRGAAGAVTAFSPIGCWKAAGLAWCRGVIGALYLVARRARPLADAAVRIPPLRAAAFGVIIGRPLQMSTELLAADLEGLASATGLERASQAFKGYLLSDTDDAGHLPLTPTTVAWGTRDLLLTHRTQSRRARRILPFVRHVDLPACGHVPFGDDPQACVRAILETTQTSS